MKKVQLGQSDLQISELAFGAWAIGGWMWGGADTRDAIKAIETAIDNGMTTIDTAAVYGFGLSEELVGKATKGKRAGVQILTKFGLAWTEKKGQYYFSTKDNNGNNIDLYKYSAKEKVLFDCDQSLRRLGTDYIDLYQIHWPDPTTSVSETMEALQILLKQGKIRAGAVCNYPLELVKEAEKFFPIASNQVPYSMVNRGIEKDVVPHCIEKNIGILAYSPLQRGLLTGKIKPGYSFNEGDSRPTTVFYREPNLSNIIQMTDKLRKIADERGVSLSQLVLNWTVQQPGITCALAGARNAEQVLDNVRATEFSLSKEELSHINEIVSSVKIEMKI